MGQPSAAKFGAFCLVGMTELGVNDGPEGNSRGVREQPREKATIFGRKERGGSGVGTAYPRLSCRCVRSLASIWLFSFTPFLLVQPAQYPPSWLLPG